VKAAIIPPAAAPAPDAHRDVYSLALSRRPRLSLIVALVPLAACSGARPAPRPPLFPPLAEWKTLLDDSVTAPLATDGRRVFVATRDGAVRALDPATGAVQWKLDGLPGRLSAAEGLLVVRDEAGTVTSLNPRTGARRWRSETGVAGVLPALLDRDRVHVAGRGLASLLLETGAPAFVDASGAETTAPPVATATRLITGEADGTLRCRDRRDGSSLWTVRTRAALLAPPLVDEPRNRLYLGTTDKRVLEVALEDGDTGWSFRIGADAAHPGLLLDERVLFAPHDAVLYSWRLGGNLDWRTGLPSRPLSAPIPHEGRVLVACLENLVVAADARTGKLEGAFKTPSEIRTPPIQAGGLLVLGMRDRSVIAYALAPKPKPAEPEEPAPAAEPAVAPPPPGR
jgi:outer membrane protein assembly factor BamB